MKVYKEIKEIAKCMAKLKSNVEKLGEKFETADIDWTTSEFVNLSKKDIEKFERTNGVTEDYYVEQHCGYCEDDFYGWLWFKTDVNGQFIKVHFSC